MTRDTTATIPLKFSGNAREYFGIWIVNFLLSIVTFGVYSAWAKVRNRKYFLGNTTIDGRPFDYHARGVQILIGRAIVVGGFVILWGSFLISPIVDFGVIVLYIAVLPWMINRAQRFNAAMTSWSNVRLRFEGNYWPAFRVFLLYPLLLIFSLFLTFPFLSRALARYRIGRHRLGEHRFAFDTEIEPFYAAFYFTSIWPILGFALVLTSEEAQGIIFAFQTGGLIDGSTTLALIAVAAVWFVTVFPLGTIYAAFTRNAIYAGTSLEGGHRFESTISPTRLVWIEISNAVAIVVSLGMLLPWARIRVARYLCAHTWVKPAGSLDAFVGEAERRQSAIGDAYIDIDGIDVGAAV